jgi:indolepyruvate decarboxylase
VVLDDAARAPADIARVLRRCLEDSRPVYIELPRDMVGAECAPVAAASPSPVDADAVAACADEIMERLGRAQRPMVMVGVELRRYRLEDKVTLLTRRLGLPVATSFMGRGLLADRQAPLIGTYMGLAGDAAVTEAIEESDALLLLGVIISDTNFGVSARHVDMRGAIVAAERQVRLGFHVYEDVPLADLIDALLVRADRTSRHRHGGQRYVRCPRPHVDRRRHGRLPVCGHGHPPHADGGARLLRDRGIRCPRWPRPAGRQRRKAADTGR